MHLAPIHLVASTKCKYAHVFLVFEGCAERTQTVVTQDLNLGVVLHQALTNGVVIDRSIFFCCNRHQTKLFFKSAITSGRTHAALKCECAVGYLPTIVDSANHVVLRATRVGEKHFAKLCSAIWLHDAAHLNAWLTHWHQQVCDARMLYRRRVGARKQEAIVGVVTTGSPNLLSIDNPLVTVEYCSGLEACQVTTAVWFAKALAPAHLAIQNLWQKFLLLFFSAPLQQSWSNKCVTKKICAHWGLCICKLFCQHHTLQC